MDDGGGGSASMCVFVGDSGTVADFAENLPVERCVFLLTR